jgi:deazaflavin-dependent oxidoreductase (nitroreductase family)
MSIANNAIRPSRQSLLLGLTRVFNRVVLLLAGTRLLPLYGVIEHRGRRSGKVFHTPVVVRPTGDGFIVPMPWGEGTDWTRNIRAAGGCVIRWKGRDYPMAQPRILDAANANAVFSGFEQSMMTRFGIRQVMHLRHQ